MTGTELVNILKSPTSKIIFFGILLIGGALVLIPMLNRDEDPSAIQENTELKQEEKAPIEIGSGIPQFKADRESEKGATPPPAVISRNGEKKITPNRSAGNRKPAVSAQSRRERNLSNLFDNRNSNGNGRTSGNAQGRIFSLSAGNKSASSGKKDEAFLSERYAPFGRLLDCKLVNTLESNVDGTPLIALVIQDLWWTNAKGERKLIIPAGTEVHGKMGKCVRNRMMSSGNFVLVWQITSDQVGLELQLQGRILEKSNQAGDKSKATITDMAAGIPGRVMNNNNLNEMLQYTMAFAQGLSAGFQTKTTYDNGSTIVSRNDGSTKNALATAFESLSNVALENITDKISKESYYIRVPAGTEFYLYIEQVTNIEKAAIADTALNKLEELKRAPGKNSSESDVEKASRLHDALGQALPKSLKKELKGIR